MVADEPAPVSVWRLVVCACMILAASMLYGWAAGGLGEVF